MNDWDYRFMSSDTLEIKPGDEFFHPQGAYYFLVTPRPTFIEQYFQKDTHYRYSIKASLSGSFMWLDTWQTTGISLSSGYTSVFRYIIEDRDVDH